MNMYLPCISIKEVSELMYEINDVATSGTYNVSLKDELIRQNKK